MLEPSATQLETTIMAKTSSASSSARVEKAYAPAKSHYAALNVDTDAALRRLARIAISTHCWQGDDIRGFGAETALDGGLATTGNYPGRARNGDEMRADLDKVFSLVAGPHRVNLHAIYAETTGSCPDRDQLAPEHFARWIDWAKQNRLGMDFNGTFFSHPRAASGMTLASPDKAVREFWIAHGVACRRVAAAMGKAVGSPCVHNVWIPDGMKDVPADRLAPRQRLRDSLDRVFKQKISRDLVLDAVEGKLFGIGSESYVVGSHEFYFGYALANDKLVTIDTGHYHPTESPVDKVSSVMLFAKELLLHVSRGIRWDSDHAVVLDDELKALACELVRGNFLDRTHIGLDYFDASINRVAAWTIGLRAMQKALLQALLEPSRAAEAEAANDFTSRLAWQEENKSLPWPAVWDYFCLAHDVPVGDAWLTEIKRHERDVLSKRM